MTKLTRKEKMFIATAAAITASLVIYILAVVPVKRRIKTLNRVIPEKKQQLQKLDKQSRQYLLICRKLKSIRRDLNRGRSLTELMPYIESLVKKQQLAEKTVDLKTLSLPAQPDIQEQAVTITLDNLTLKEAVDFLVSVEASRPLTKIRSLRIKKSSINNNRLILTANIHTLRPDPSESSPS